MSQPETDWDRYWWAYGPKGWVIETWRGDPLPGNVVEVCVASSLEQAEAIVMQLNTIVMQLNTAVIEMAEGLRAPIKNPDI